MKRFAWAVPTVLFLVVLAGCADPTRDKPEAAVDEPAPEPERPEAAERFVLTEESSIGFVGSKVTGSHDGGFHAFEGEILLVDGDPSKSRVEITIDTTSLWADNDRLTGHLKSADFFEVETYPTATFTSTEIRQEEEGGYEIVGNLMLHGVTKNISFPAEIVVEDDRVTAAAEFAIRRFDFDIEYRGKRDDLIRDNVLIKLDVVAARA